MAFSSSSESAWACVIGASARSVSSSLFSEATISAASSFSGNLTAGFFDGFSACLGFAAGFFTVADFAAAFFAAFFSPAVAVFFTGFSALLGFALAFLPVGDLAAALVATFIHVTCLVAFAAAFVSPTTPVVSDGVSTLDAAASFFAFLPSTASFALFASSLHSCHPQPPRRLMIAYSSLLT